MATSFAELTQNAPLVYNSSTGLYDLSTTRTPSPTSTGRGLIFFDDYDVSGKMVADTSQEQTSKVAVTGATTYTLNYLNGTVANPDTAPTAITYSWNYVSVISGWPGTNPPPLPFISMGTDGRRKDGFQLGGGVKNSSTMYFYVFATSDADGP